MKKIVWKIVRSLPVSTWLSLLALSLFFWLWIFGHQGLAELEGLRHLKAQLKEQKKELKKERETLEKELKNLQDPLYQKYLVHKELGLTQKDEIMILFPSIIDTSP